MPHNNFEGFDTRLHAERAYLLAYALGGVRRLPSRDAPRGYVPPAVPMPVRLMERFAALPSEYLGAEWYVVFKGKAPGIYPSWYVFIYSNMVH